MNKPFTVPMSPEQLPQQRLVEVIDLPPLPPGIRIITDALKIPTKHSQRAGPKDSKFLVALEWAWSPMHSRLQGFYLERHDERDWVLWSYFVDLEENGDDPWVVSAVCPRSDMDERTAAVHLLIASLYEEIEVQDLDHWHWIADTGLLGSAEMRSIGRHVWPRER
jgi:hypothetical protein